MKDSILRATAANGFLRVFVANTKQTVQEAFDEAIKIKGQDASVIVMPFGGSTLPKVEN